MPLFLLYFGNSCYYSRIMAKNSKSRKRRNSRLNKIVTAVIFIVVLGIFLYEKVPQVREFADPKIEKAKTAISRFLPTEPQTQEDKNSPSKNEAADKTSSAAPASDDFIYLSQNLAEPRCAGTGKNVQDHEHRAYEYYSLCYRESYEQAEWSAYCLTDGHLVKNASRSDDFRADPKISTGSATPDDYKKTGYDRGHLSPAADFAFDKTAMSETFYMTNMSPQAGSFNRGIWKDLESTVRDWAKKFGRVYVVSGPILEKNAGSYKSIGANKVSVPEYYYKVILAPLYEDENDKNTPDDAKNIAAIGFIFPNQKCTDTIFNYAVTVAEVEKRTGIDFFYELEDTAEKAAESDFDKSIWE